MEPFIPATGAHPSHVDSRTISHTSLAENGLLTTGGVLYKPENIEMQAKVGICCAASVVQNAEKYWNKKYSIDFHWLILKTLFDKNWYEGSEIMNSLKVGWKYGFLPVEKFPYVTDTDRTLPYDQYIAKLQSIPQSEITALLAQCENKLLGFAQLGIDPVSIAHGIDDSACGIVCMLQSGSTWWTAPNGTISWATSDIDPIRVPTESLSGHAITASYYDYTKEYLVTYPNTWGTTWNAEGNCHIDLTTYKMVEAWIPYYVTTPTQQGQIDSIQPVPTPIIPTPAPSVPIKPKVTWSYIFQLIIEWFTGSNP